MKNSTLKSKTIAVTILFAITITLASVSAQKIDRKSMFSSTPTIEHNIEYFKVMEINKRLYFKFLITEHKENTAYILESSLNGQTYAPCQIKEGYKSPNNTPLLYCFSEKMNEKSNTTYRIKRVTFDGNIAYTCALVLDENNISRKWTSCSSDNYDEQKTLKRFNDNSNDTEMITIASASSH